MIVLKMQKKSPPVKMGFLIKSLAMTYFHMATCHTIIGAKRFHFRVRDGIGWFTLAMVTKQTGVLMFNQRLFNRFFSTFAIASVALPPAALEICNLCISSFSRMRLADAKSYPSLSSQHSNSLGVIWSSLTGN